MRKLKGGLTKKRSCIVTCVELPVGDVVEEYTSIEVGAQSTSEVKTAREPKE